MPPLSSQCVPGAAAAEAACALWVSLLGRLPRALGAPPGSLLPPSLAALLKSEAGGTLVAGRAFGRAKTTSGKRGRAGWVREDSCVYCQVNVRPPWTPEEEASMETLELGTLAVPPGSLSAS